MIKMALLPIRIRIWLSRPNTIKRIKPKKYIECSSDDEVDDVKLALMVKNIIGMLKKLNKEGIKFYSRKNNFFISSKRRSISDMDFYNFGEFGHLARRCTKTKKNK